MKKILFIIIFITISMSLIGQEASILERLKKLEEENLELKKQILELLSFKQEILLRNAFTSPLEILQKNPKAPSGLYTFSVNGQLFQAYVDTDRSKDGGGWVMLYNSVGNPKGPSAVGYENTLSFWKIPYANRFSIKGTPNLKSNYYNGILYLVGEAEYRDDLEDLAGKTGTLFKANAKGINSKNMRMIEPKLLSGNSGIYSNQFAAGWCSYDFDADDWSNNCSSYYSEVTQHYGACWRYNLGSDAVVPYSDNAWGPHCNSAFITWAKTDGSAYTRVNRITRWIRW